ncbi:galactokinase [Cecembia lonarensis]|uniref:Galactokinase n=1 Tax=Cecembia lonarensis (strain CCUG 58316 / KCTC 22772 / LW9) TaxID=1225176 RepID=K1L576_CECL9|nr:galactokinase [Cecembia lonarensis]EKB49926.1 Galactokinase [Cecembia lonarensis LW9]
MKIKISDKFREIFQQEPYSLYFSPGRINLIGEHTDYNEGFVMPAAIDLGIYVAISANELHVCRIYSLDFDEEFSINLNSLAPKKGHWATYIMGVISQLQQAGYPVKGFDMVFGGDLPVGAGLSSSAAIECAVGFSISSLFGFNIPKHSLMHYAQKAEHLFAGVQCGIMDQFASVMGKKDHVIKLDCRDLSFNYFPLDLGDFKLLLVDTQVKHSLADSAYNRRRNECAEVVLMAQQNQVGVASLRDLKLKHLNEIKPFIDREVLGRGVYVIEENERVIEASEALKEGNILKVGKLMYASHEGLSKKYGVSCQELDFLVDQSKSLDFVIGSRMMGGGFGGCTINILQKEKVGQFKDIIASAYLSKFGKAPKFYEISLGDGTREI